MKTVLLALLFALTADAHTPLRIDLSGDWRITIGDRPEFARPDFDDSGWKTLSLPLGDKHIREVHWLRHRVELPEGADITQLALTLGTIQDVYEVFVNGRKIGASGDWDNLDGHALARPRTFQLPADAVAQNHPSLIIALRIKQAMSLVPIWILPDRGPYVLSHHDNAPHDAGMRQLDEQFMTLSPRLMFGSVSLAIGILGLVAWVSDRRRRELLWLGFTAVQVFTTNFYMLFVLRGDTHVVNRLGRAPIQAIIDLTYLPLLGSLILSALGIRSRALYAAVWIAWSPLLTFPFISGLWMNYGQTAICVILLATILWDWRRLGRRRAVLDEHLLRLVFLLPVWTDGLFWMANTFGPRGGNGPILFLDGPRVGQYTVAYNDVFWLLLSVVILALLIRRVAADRKDHQRLAGELNAARTVQQALIAKSATGTGDTPIDAVYEPAQEVGGDFYQIIPMESATDAGGILLLVGDVSGKGLNAAMLVSLVIGAGRRNVHASPAEMLSGLNTALEGHANNGFVTCCCALLALDGRLTIANAGHLPPYRNGKEIELEAGLPLGIVPDATYAEATIQLVPADQVTFLSDGVVEAANPKGELFGFDRTRDISRQSAQQIAEAAKAWGQNDDITVVTVRRSA